MTKAIIVDLDSCLAAADEVDEKLFKPVADLFRPKLAVPLKSARIEVTWLGYFELRSTAQPIPAVSFGRNNWLQNRAIWPWRMWMPTRNRSLFIGADSVLCCLDVA